MGGLGFSPTASIPKRAIGGSVTKGESYIVGEQGRELFTASSNGTISSNSSMESSAPVVNVYNNTPSNVSVSNSGDGIDIIIEQVESHIASGIAYGTGLVGEAIQGTYGMSR